VLCRWLDGLPSWIQPLTFTDFQAPGTATRPLRRSDFELEAYRKSDNRRALFQVISTLAPMAALWWLVPQVAAGQPLERLLLLPILVLLVLFSSRSFSLMHDCGHRSLFASRWLNQFFGFVFGVVNGIPEHPWSRGHAYHHNHNGNWDRYRGPSALLSLDQFRALSPLNQRLYAISRHPLMLLPGGFFYLVIKPRISLILALVDRIASQLKGPDAAPAKRYQPTQAELADLVANNVLVLASWWAMGQLLGVGLFWSCYAIVMTFSAAIFICIFFVQHNYQGSYASGNEGWSYLEGAVAGSSNLELPWILNWFSADIAFHSIHHLCERIPNYRLRQCHERNAHLLMAAKRLTLSDIPGCFRYILWDSKDLRLISLAEAAG
jgi:omega-6 fatty acid desaturase (delta-12 desaturase)